MVHNTNDSIVIKIQNYNVNPETPYRNADGLVAGRPPYIRGEALPFAHIPSSEKCFDYVIL